MNAAGCGGAKFSLVLRLGRSLLIPFFNPN
jgi:hypothetical protein